MSVRLTWIGCDAFADGDRRESAIMSFEMGEKTPETQVVTYQIENRCVRVHSPAFSHPVSFGK